MMEGLELKVISVVAMAIYGLKCKVWERVVKLLDLFDSFD